jgi:outer membrane protein
MKNASTITNVILGAAVIVLFVLHFTSAKETAETPASPEGTQQPAGDIVYIQVDSLINKYDMFNDLRSEFENKAQTIQNDLNKRGRSLENDLKDFQTKIQKGLITRSQAETQRQQLQVRDQELQQYIQEKQMEMSEEEAVLYRKVFDALDRYLEEMNKDNKYALILSTSGSSNNVLNGNKKLDITDEVVSAMNDEYIKEKSR